MAANYGAILTAIGLITLVVNVITEVVKKSVPWMNSAKRINLFVMGLSEVITLVSGIAYWQINAMPMQWYTVAAFIVVGFGVAYSAMFGFDKFIAYFEGINDKAKN